MASPTPLSQPPARRRHQLTRTAFYVHLWLGVIFTVVLTAISITGILLNHKRGLGLMPDVAHEPTAAFATALPLAALAESGIKAVQPDAALDIRLIDRNGCAATRRIRENPAPRRRLV